jgi:hypothetical protein
MIDLAPVGDLDAIAVATDLERSQGSDVAVTSDLREYWITVDAYGEFNGDGIGCLLHECEYADSNGSWGEGWGDGFSGDGNNGNGYGIGGMCDD